MKPMRFLTFLERAIQVVTFDGSLARVLIYIQLVEFEGYNKYCTAVAGNVQEARKLLGTGFEYVYSHKGEMLFKKRK
jgi:hypothetical protein